MAIEYTDLNHVHHEHKDTHARLINWALWYRDSKSSSVMPMFRGYKSKWRQWHTPEVRDTPDGADAQKIEKIVTSLPIEQRKTLVWYYMSNLTPSAYRRSAGISTKEIYQLLVIARQNILNLG